MTMNHLNSMCIAIARALFNVSAAARLKLLRGEAWLRQKRHFVLFLQL
jgi:hypothetical protein